MNSFTKVFIFFYRLYTGLSIKVRLSISLTIILIIGFSAINILNYNLASSTLKKSIRKDSLPGIINDIYHEIQTSLNSTVQISSLMASDTFLKDWVIEKEKDKSKITRYLWEIKSKYGFFSTFMVSKKTKKYYHFKGLHKIISRDNAHDKWYYNFIESGQDYELVVDTNEASDGTLTIFINHRLNDYHGKFIGITGVGLKMTKVGYLFKSFEKNYNKKVYLVDKSGLIQVHSDQRNIHQVNIRTKKGLGEISGEILAQNSSSVIKEYQGEKGSMILISKYIPELNWFLIVEHRAEDQLKKIKFNFIQNLVIGALVTILVIIINIFVVNFYQNKLEKYASTDELTGLPNRRFFKFQAKRDLAQALRNKNPISLLILDIDHFKKINDTFGHEAGDLVLIELARRIPLVLRSYDLSGRIGGEEFAIILPNTDLNGAKGAAERIKKLVHQISVPYGKGDLIQITVSIGGVSLENSENISLGDFINMADKALYVSKNRGRDKISFYEIKDVKNDSGSKPS